MIMSEVTTKLESLSPEGTAFEPMPDEKDRIFYDMAKSCKARLITGNFKHYPVDEYVTALWELKSKK